MAEKGVNSLQKSTWIVVGIAVIFIGILIAQFLQDPHAQYLSNLAREREERVAFFRESTQSPLTDSVKATFKGLNYFEPNPAFSLIGNFIPTKGYELIELSRFGGEPEVYIRSGQIEFELEGKKHLLTAYRRREGSSAKDLFVPFKDLTSGKTTYGGGRYLDLRLVVDEVHIDFNRAYNPFCVFNPAYVCPIPPEENHLSIEIPVGEKAFKKSEE